MFNISRDLVKLSFQIDKLSLFQTLLFSLKLSINFIVLTLLVGSPFIAVATVASIIDSFMI
tara:strand:+ start:2189 stop:2371 length:183 start_codon:yes stop_codon:yes gene_type:complete